MGWAGHPAGPAWSPSVILAFAKSAGDAGSVLEASEETEREHGREEKMMGQWGEQKETGGEEAERRVRRNEGTNLKRRIGKGLQNQDEGEECSQERRKYTI